MEQSDLEKILGRINKYQLNKSPEPWTIDVGDLLGSHDIFGLEAVISNIEDKGYEVEVTAGMMTMWKVRRTTIN